jgi:hypothetical protein
LGVGAHSTRQVISRAAAALAAAAAMRPLNAGEGVKGSIERIFKGLIFIIFILFRRDILITL